MDYFAGIDPTILDDMTKATAADLELIRIRLKEQDERAILDEQVELLITQAHFAKNVHAFRAQVKLGRMSDMDAATRIGWISRAAYENHQKIVHNGLIIKTLLSRPYPRVEA